MKLQSIAAIPACSEYAFQLSCLRKNRCPRSQFPEALQTHAVFPRESYGLIGKRGTIGGNVAGTRRFHPILSAHGNQPGSKQRKQLW